MLHTEVNELDRKGATPFQLLGEDGFFSSWSGDTVRCCLDGMVRVKGSPDSAIDGSNRDKSVKALIQSYRAKGEAFFGELTGSFRLALWDVEAQKLLVAVDPFATRPLYYSCAKGVLSVAPRISLLVGALNVARTIDPNAIFFYLNHSFIPAPYTAYREIRRLLPGQYLRWQDGRVTLGQHWDLRYDEDSALTETSAAQLVHAAVERSVRSYVDALPDHDDQIGAFLSGGTDSSTLVGLMTRVRGKPVKTFSVGFSEERYNEIAYARIAARCYNADAHERFVSAEEALSAMPLLAAEFDEPFGNSSAIPTFFCLQSAREAGVRTMFAGDGGDELFGGNERYLAEKYFLPFDVLPKTLQSRILQLTPFLPSLYLFRKLRRYLEQASLLQPERYFRYQTFISKHADEFLTADFRGELEDGFELRVPEEHYGRVAAAAPLNRLLYMDLKMCIADNDLFKVNRMAGAAGIDVYYPYLDRDLAEVTGRIPAKLKIKGTQKRFIFKKAFQELLPQEILRKTKHGFGMPTGDWLKHHIGFRDLARSLLLEPRAVQRGYFKKSTLESLLKRHDEESSSYYGTYIWYFMMLELWHRYHVDQTVNRRSR